MFVISENSAPPEGLIVPHVLSPTFHQAEPTQGVPPRIQHNVLISWGFTSTTFSAEPVQSPASWLVTIERNLSHVGPWTTGYLFGVGVSPCALVVRDMVGRSEHSYGLICNGGMLFMCRGGKEEPLMALKNLPVSITLTVNIIDSYMTLLYHISTTDRKCVLEAKQVVSDPQLQQHIQPVFTVSQKVRLLFPSIVWTNSFPETKEGW